MGVAYLITTFWYGNRCPDANFAYVDSFFLVITFIALWSLQIFFKPTNLAPVVTDMINLFFGFLYIFFLFNFVTKILFIDGVDQGAFYVFYCLNGE